MFSKFLAWYPELKYGYYPVQFEDMPYDKEYADNYATLADTDIGRRLNIERVDLVNKYLGEMDHIITDVGIGDGAFMKEAVFFGRDKVYGYDVNPWAVEKLIKESRWRDLTKEYTRYATFWDSLEHIPDPRKILARVLDGCFVSIPIFDDAEHVLRSKHYKKNEHFWYFTKDGFIEYMQRAGFELLEYNRMESDIGREDIGTFVFKRV